MYAEELRRNIGFDLVTDYVDYYTAQDTVGDHGSTISELAIWPTHVCSCLVLLIAWLCGTCMQKYTMACLQL